MFCCCSTFSPSAEGETKEDVREVMTEELLTIGNVSDMFNKRSRDSIEWRKQTTQADKDCL